MGLVSSGGLKFIESGAFIPVDLQRNLFSLPGLSPFNLRFVNLNEASARVLIVDGDLVLLNFNLGSGARAAWADLLSPPVEFRILFSCAGTASGYGFVLNYTLYELPKR